LLVFLAVQRGKGAVVAISSQMHRLGAYAAPYGAEKATMNAICNALHHKLHGSGVTAQAMVLGAVITPGLASMMTPAKPAAASASQAVAAEGAAAAAAAGTGSGSGSSSTDAPAALVSPFSNTTPSSTSTSSSSSSSSSSSHVAAAMAAIKPTVTMPSSETAAAAIVRNIGRGGPVVTPYWGHAMSEALLLDAWWPPELRMWIEGKVAR
jgi:hypothetical protein